MDLQSEPTRWWRSDPLFCPKWLLAVRLPWQPTPPPPFRTERPGNNVPVLEMQTNAPASDHKLMAVLHGHRRPHLRCFSLARPPTAQTPSWAVHLNNALPGTQTSFVYWQDLAVSHFVFAHLHKHQMVPVSSVCVRVHACMCVWTRGSQLHPSLVTADENRRQFEIH